MRDHTAHHRHMKYIFSADKLWVLILLVSSNILLITLVFVIFNQEYGLFSTKSLLPKEDFYNTSVVNTKVGYTGQVTFEDHIQNITLDFNRIFTGSARFNKNSQNINEYYKEYNFSPDSTFKISVSEYVVGQKYTLTTKVGTASAKKTVYEMDKQIKWLSSLDTGIQKTIKYDPNIKNPTETTILVKKIGKQIYYVNDYISSSRTWVREYQGYDVKKKQLIKVTLLTNEKVITSQKVPEYSKEILSRLNTIEGIISSESNSAE